MKLNRRIFLTFVPVFFLLFSGSLVSYVSFTAFREAQKMLYYENLIMYSLSSQYDDMRSVFLRYLQFKKFEDLDKYLQTSAQLKDTMNTVEKSLKNEERSLVTRDILGLLDSFLEVSDKAVVLKRNRRVSEYFDEYLKSLEIDGYIGEFMAKYNRALLNANAEDYISLDKRDLSLQRIFITLLILLSVLSLLFMSVLSNRISDPVVELTRRARRIAEGHYSDVSGHSPDDTAELSELSESFTIMAQKIAENFKLLGDKVTLQEALHSEEVSHARARESAVKAEFTALQSQINPHFIFNTLNAGVQLAMFERAGKTEDFLNKFSTLLRYSLKNQQEPVHLSQELEQIRNYLNLMEIRFGNIFTLKCSPLDSSLLSARLPRTILQPIVENVFVHVLQYREFLEIGINARHVDGFIHLEILDNGPGFSRKTAQEIERLKSFDFQELEALTRDRIGLTNVYFRMRLFYGDLFEMAVIDEEEKKGLRLILPPGDQNVQGTDR